MVTKKMYKQISSVHGLSVPTVMSKDWKKQYSRHNQTSAMGESTANENYGIKKI